jgi:hypothetical protein
VIASQCRWLVVLPVFALMLFLGGGSSADAAETKGVFCMDVTSSLTGVVFKLNLNYTLNTIPFGGARGHSLFYGSSCYVVPATPGTPSTSDCAPVHGSGIVFEDRFEMSLQGAENQQDFGVDVLTINNVHIWIKNLANLTGTWSGEANSYIDGGPQGVRQFDKCTAAAVTCPLF